MQTAPAQPAQVDVPLPAARFSDRVGLGLLGLLLAGLLVTAAWLEPNPTGLGTHRQLGLPGCTLYTWAGVRCPGCGMTTSWAHTMNGDLKRGLQTNTAGVLLCLTAMGTAPCLLWYAIRGKLEYQRILSQVGLALVVSAIGIALLEWVIRLASNVSF